MYVLLLIDFVIGLFTLVSLFMYVFICLWVLMIAPISIPVPKLGGALQAAPTKKYAYSIAPH